MTETKTRDEVRYALRPNIEAFAQLMELRMRMKQHPSWTGSQTPDLFQRVSEHLGDVAAALREGRRADAARYCVDVANFAMMLNEHLSNARTS